MVDVDLFSDFPVDELAALFEFESEQKHVEEVKQARAIQLQTRRELRRAKNEATLAELLPAVLPAETSWHVISYGDIDSLSYARHIVRTQRLDHLMVSTWCMARNDVEEIAGWLATGRVKCCDWYVGEIFPNQYGDEYELVKTIVAKYGGRVCVARNHSKVMAGKNDADGYFFAIESSANINTNPRIEQTAVHRSEDLYHFYADFFADLINIDRTNVKTAKPVTNCSGGRSEPASDP